MSVLLQIMVDFRDSRVGMLIRAFCDEYAETHRCNDELMRAIKSEISHGHNRFNIFVDDAEKKFIVRAYTVPGKRYAEYEFGNFTLDEEIAQMKSFGYVCDDIYDDENVESFLESHDIVPQPDSLRYVKRDGEIVGFECKLFVKFVREEDQNNG